MDWIKKDWEAEPFLNPLPTVMLSSKRVMKSIQACQELVNLK